MPTLRLLTADGEHRVPPDVHRRATLSRLLGPSAQGGQRVASLDVRYDVVVVEWRLTEPDRLSEWRTTAQEDVYDLLRWAHLVSTSAPGEAPRRFTFVGLQQRGPEADPPSERRMIELTYSVEQVATIDWDTFRPPDAYAVAETATIDPILLQGADGR